MLPWQPNVGQNHEPTFIWHPGCLYVDLSQWNIKPFQVLHPTFPSSSPFPSFCPIPISAAIRDVGWNFQLKKNKISAKF